jgi:hypothetical protein
MSYPDLRQSLLYQRALQTPSIIFKRADSPGVRWSRNYDPRDADNYRVESAGYRLDHMIRRVLDPATDQHFPNPDLLSAIKTFIEMLDQMLPLRTVSAQTRAFIEPRLQLCQRIIARADRTLAEHGYPPVSSDAFRHLVTVFYTNAPEMRGARYDDKTIRDPVFRTVFDNPFYADGFFLPFGKSDEACSFMVHIRQWYWN